MKAEQRKKWAQRAVAAALTLLALAALPSLWTLAFCPQGSCSLPERKDRPGSKVLPGRSLLFFGGQPPR